MIGEPEVRELINDLFQEVALVLGGLAAVHKIEDDVIWRLVKSFDAIRRKYLRRLGDEGPDDEGGGPSNRPHLKPHPAIEDFLLTLRRG